MFFTHSFIVLCVSLIAQGAVVAPSGRAASDAAPMVESATMTPAPSATAALYPASNPLLSTEGMFDGDSDRHRNPIPIPIPLPAPILPPACPGPGPGTGSGGNTPGPISGGGTSSSQVITVITTITTTSNRLNTVLGGLTTDLQFRDVASISQVLIQGFRTIIVSLARAAPTLLCTSPFRDSVAGTVVDALVEFVRVHQALLATVIGKHAVFAQFELTARIEDTLDTLQSAVDAFAFALIKLVPTKRNTVTAQINSLDLTLKTSINKYRQSCFPSNDYPQTMPICIRTSI